MEFMKEAVEDWSKDEADARNESDSAEKSVAASEKFARAGIDGRERAHTRQNHRRVGESIEPRELFEVMIAGHADAKRTDDDGCAENDTARESRVENLTRQQWLAAALVHVKLNQSCEATF